VAAYQSLRFCIAAGLQCRQHFAQGEIAKTNDCPMDLSIDRFGYSKVGRLPVRRRQWHIRIGAAGGSSQTWQPGGGSRQSGAFDELAALDVHEWSS
jgi:hypothetical protein